MIIYSKQVVPVAENSWVKIGDKWYYGNQEGKINRDKWAKIDGLWYRFDESGVMLVLLFIKTIFSRLVELWRKMPGKNSKISGIMLPHQEKLFATSGRKSAVHGTILIKTVSC